MSPQAVRVDAVVTLLALALLLLWDASGADLVMSRWIAGPGGFPWRDAWLTRTALHEGGRWLSALALLLVVVDAVRLPATGPSRRRRLEAVAAVLFGLLLVPTMKRASLSSCPWDLAEFGGSASYVSHWLFGVADGGPGHCFPSGHAVAAFAFFAMYFLWRDDRPGWARAWLAGTLVAGTLFGLAQWLRGAHYVSHTLWSAWLCWALAAALSRLLPALRRAPLVAPPGWHRDRSATP